jgi:hypothetical protein
VIVRVVGIGKTSWSSVENILHGSKGADVSPKIIPNVPTKMKVGYGCNKLLKLVTAIRKFMLALESIADL